jgi:2,4-dienoyl-CoA reductase-like NADH-dependent reductase (Old Yellow Enzyme family)/thioredoxin reductase
MKRYPMLFRPLTIGALSLKNRLVMAPMTTGYGGIEGHATQDLIDFYRDRARGGVGLITCESCYVNKRGKGFVGQLALDDDKFIPDLARLVRAVHEDGARVMLQLIHCGRQTGSALCGGQPVAPSAIPCPVVREMPRALAPEEIQALVGDFAGAAVRAKEAGFDGVEIHAAHGYLINQFLSPYSNRRTDEYGGSLFNRSRLLLEILAEIKARLSETYPVSCRISAEEFVSDGLTLAESRTLARWLQNAGLDVLSVSGGVYESAYRIIPPMDVEPGSLAYLAQGIKEAVSIPVVTVGGISEPSFAERILLEGKADLVALGRALLADPEWAAKAGSGEPDRIRPCIYCNHCRNRALRPRANCAVNYETGREGELAPRRRANRQRRVVVAGGGIAGMEAAYIAALRGHQVTLFEQGTALGGNLLIACLPPGRGRLAKIVGFLKAELDRLGVRVLTGVRADAPCLKGEDPDVVLLATGSEPFVPEIPGIRGPNVHYATDVLRGTAEVGFYVVVIGGGLIGLETADYLRERGKAVTVIEKLPEVAADPRVEGIFKRYLVGRLSRTTESVLLLTSTEVREIGPGFVRIRQPPGEKVLSGVDSVVLATGLKALLPLNPEDLGPGTEVHVIGDAVTPRTLFEAVHTAAQAAYGL